MCFDLLNENISSLQDPKRAGRIMPDASNPEHIHWNTALWQEKHKRSAISLLSSAAGLVSKVKYPHRHCTVADYILCMLFHSFVT